MWPKFYLTISPGLALVLNISLDTLHIYTPSWQSPLISHHICQTHVFWSTYFCISRSHYLEQTSFQYQAFLLCQLLQNHTYNDIYIYIYIYTKLTTFNINFPLAAFVSLVKTWKDSWENTRLGCVHVRVHACVCDFVVCFWPIYN